MTRSGGGLAGAIVSGLLLLHLLRRLVPNGDTIVLTIDLVLLAIAMVALFAWPPLVQRDARRVIRERQEGPTPAVVAEVVAFRPVGGFGRTAALLVDHDGVRLVRAREEVVLPWTSIRRTSMLLSYLLGRPWGLTLEADGHDRPIEVILLARVGPGTRSARAVRQIVEDVRAARPAARPASRGAGAAPAAQP